MQSPPKVTVVAMAGHLDSDLIPHFLKHYRALGVSGFLFTLHGDFNEECRTYLLDQPDVRVVAEVFGLFSEPSKVEKIDWMLHGLEGEWVLMCDLDEFIELPADSLAETIAAMDEMGMTSLPAFMVQRISEDGSLPDLAANDDIHCLYPRYSFNLAERLGCSHPPIKIKYPLAKATEGYSAKRGFHFPLVADVAIQNPLRATLSHFKWRKQLEKSVQSYRGKETNAAEMAAFGAHLKKFDGELPLEGSHPYERADLIRRGLLVPLAGAGPGERQSKRASGCKQASPPAYERAGAGVDSSDGGLRICLVTNELMGPGPTGGVGTAASAMAENLAAVGHSITILYVPYGPWSVFDSFWTEVWLALGIELIQLDLHDARGERLDHRQLKDKVLRHLEREHYDIAHFDDAQGLGASACQLRASGLGLQDTAMVMTTHGCMYWHSASGNVPRNRALTEYHCSYEQQARLADLVIHPSQYMQQWVSNNVTTPRNECVVFNALPGLSRSFSCRQWQHRRPDELVFFGRVEPRKGFRIFLKAVEELTQRGATIEKITLMGGIGESLSEEQVRRDLESVTDEVSLITSFPGIDAVNYLKAHDCFVVIPSLRDNLPYTVYECLENDIPMICSDVDGNRELVDERDWSRTLVASDPGDIADAVIEAMENGWLPARLAFDADEVAREQVATFVSLHEDADREGAARASNSSILALGFAEAGMTTPDHQNEMLEAAPLDLRFVADLGRDARHFEPVVAEMNRAIAASDEDYVLLCHRSVQIVTPELLPAMIRMLDLSSFDAVVCDYYPRHVSADGMLLGIGATIRAPGGPPQQAPSSNIFGAGLALIRRSSLVEAGMIDDDCARAETLVWEVLNKMCARGGTVTSVPRTLVCKTIEDVGLVNTIGDRQLHERLSRHWLGDLDFLRSTMVSAAIFEDFVKCPFTHQLLDACTMKRRSSDNA